MENNLFPYKWNLKDGYPSKNIKKNNYKAFGFFICGGGSSMGCKLAGFNHLGGVEVDKTISAIYKLNHNPKYLYTEDIRVFNERKDLPAELYDIDLLEGSPPCSSFSISGNREADWSKKKMFAEGQTKQVLDDLVFVYVNTIKKLNPKIAILENVKGIILGNAKYYAKEIVKRLSEKYRVQVFLLNAASMGVPQKRERVFFICQRKDLNMPELKLTFKEKSIAFKDIDHRFVDANCLHIRPSHKPYYKLVPPGKNMSKVHPNKSFFNTYKAAPNCPINTITANVWIIHPYEARYVSDYELAQCGTFPTDYNYNKKESRWIIGMSVPPVMMAQIVNQIRLQWLDKYYLTKLKQV